MQRVHTVDVDVIISVEIVELRWVIVLEPEVDVIVTGQVVTVEMIISVVMISVGGRGGGVI